MSSRITLSSRLKRLASWPRVTLLCALLAPAPLSAAPLVATSIRPLQHVAAAIMDGVGEVQLALAPNQDPHHLSLKPSERQLLENAGVVLWVGPALELPLERLAGQLPGRVLSAQALAAGELIAADDGHDHGGVDPHLWLDTRIVARLAAALADELARQDPDNAARYAANLAAFRDEVHATETRLAGILAPLRDRSWAVEHHAFRYLERQFSLSPALQLRDSDNREAGARSVRRLQQALREAGLSCIVAEPQVAAAPLRNLLGDPRLRVASVDILGHELAPGRGSWSRMMLGIAEAIASCAGATP